MKTPTLPPRLLWQWRVLALATLLAWLGTWSLGWRFLHGKSAAVLSGVLLLWWLLRIRQRLPENRSSPEGPVLSFLPLATWVTWLRGTLVLLAAGWVLVPPSRAPQEWLAAVLAGAMALDFGDGYLARKTGQTTVMGAALDVDLDGLAVLVAVGLGWRWGRLPPWYWAVGLARYLFLGVEAWQRHRGRTAPLPPSPTRRALAGLQMAFLAAALMPVFSPTAARMAAIFFGLPFLLHFTADILWVMGWRPTFSRPPQNLVRALLYLVRWSLAGWLAWKWLPAAEAWMPWPWGPTWVWVVGGSGLVLLAWGWAPRIGAALWFPLWAWAVEAKVFSPPEKLAVASGLAILLHLGGGVWRPEDALWARFWGGSSPSEA